MDGRLDQQLFETNGSLNASDCCHFQAIEYQWSIRNNQLTTPAPEMDLDLKCPDIGTNTQKKENNTAYKNVSSWGECAQKCREREGCKYWTWHVPHGTFKPLECHTLTGASSTSRDNNCISGKSDCVGRQRSQYSTLSLVLKTTNR